MEVTRDNFDLLLPQIRNEIKECEYLSLDCEFSGIGGSYLKFFDTHQERYEKKLKTEMQYDIVQFGLSIFKPIDGGEIKCSCYNFYIFKYHVKNSILPDYKLNVSSSAFEFLSINKFDFNKLFKQGITYCNVEEEQELTASLKRMNNELIVNEKVNLKKQKLVHETLAEYNQFLKDSNQFGLELGPYEKDSLNLVKETIVNAEKNRNSSPGNNLGLIKDGLNLEIKVNRIKNEKNILWKLEINKVVNQKKEESSVIDCDLIANEQIGFSKVIQTIIEYRKPIVGHNVLVDIMHIINQFIYPLPLNYQDFKFVTKELFPLIFDTKLISLFLEKLNNQRVKSLGDLYKYFQVNYPKYVNSIKLTNSDFSDLDQSIDFTLDRHDEPNFHQAGFDSYITGICFQVLKRLVESKPGKSIYKDIRFKNKFYNAWSFDIPFLSSEDNQDAQIDRSNVYFIEFECEPSYLEKNIFSTIEILKIEYLTSTSCLVAIPDGKAMKMLEIVNSNNEIHVISYDVYKKKTMNRSMDERARKKMKVENLSNTSINLDQTPLNNSRSSNQSSVSSKNQFKNDKTSLVNRKKLFDEEDDWCKVN